MPHPLRYQYREPTALPLFKFVIVVGGGLFAGLMVLSAYLEPAPSLSTPPTSKAASASITSLAPVAKLGQ
jgi:hypothetical protein